MGDNYIGTIVMVCSAWMSFDSSKTVTVTLLGSTVSLVIITVT